MVRAVCRGIRPGVARETATAVAKARGVVQAAGWPSSAPVHPGTGPAFGQAVLAALVEEAFVHGAETLFTVVSERQVTGYADTGWTVAAHVITFHSNP